MEYTPKDLPEGMSNRNEKLFESGQPDGFGCLVGKVLDVANITRWGLF